MRAIVEWFVAISLIATSVGLVAMRAPDCCCRSLTGSTRIRLESLSGKLQILALDCGHAPEEIGALLVPGDCGTRWMGPYARPGELLDAWGNSVAYVTIPTVRAGLLCSFGGDTVIGGARDLCTTIDFSARVVE